MLSISPSGFFTSLKKPANIRFSGDNVNQEKSKELFKDVAELEAWTREHNITADNIFLPSTSDAFTSNPKRLEGSSHTIERTKLKKQLRKNKGNEDEINSKIEQHGYQLVLERIKQGKTVTSVPSAFIEVWRNFFKASGEPITAGSIPSVREKFLAHLEGVPRTVPLEQDVFKSLTTYLQPAALVRYAKQNPK